MKLAIFLFLLLLLLPLGAQLHTRYTPLPAVARRYAVAFVFPRTMIWFEVVRR